MVPPKGCMTLANLSLVIFEAMVTTAEWLPRGLAEQVIIDVSGPAVNSPEEFTMTPVQNTPTRMMTRAGSVMKTVMR